MLIGKSTLPALYVCMRPVDASPGSFGKVKRASPLQPPDALCHRSLVHQLSKEAVLCSPLSRFILLVHSCSVRVRRGMTGTITISTNGAIAATVAVATAATIATKRTAQKQNGRAVRSRRRELRV